MSRFDDRNSDRNDDRWGPSANVEPQLPQSADAETSVLGSILIGEAETLAEVSTILDPADFYQPSHGEIYAAMLSSWRKSKVVDLITITDELMLVGKLDLVGGVSYVSSLANQVPTSANALHYARIVERCAVLRKLIAAAGEIAGIAYHATDASDAIEAANAILTGATLRRGGRDSRPFADVVDAFLDECDDAAYGETLPGVLTGLTALDKHLLGFKPGDLIYLCGRPGSGKSAYAASIAAYVATEAARRGDVKAVEWVSLEMTDIQQAKRLITSWAGLNGRIVRAGFRRPDGSVDEDALARTHDAGAELKAAYGQTLRMYDKRLNLTQLRQHITSAVYRRGCQLVVVDYLGLVSADDMRQSEYERITNLSVELKQLALELRIPILCLVQLNRDCEKRTNKRPMSADLRSSGGLEQDADIILGIYRGAKYNPQYAANDEHFRQLGEIIVLKARDGVADVTIPTRFQSEFTRPGDWPDEWEYKTYLKVNGSEDWQGERQEGGD